MQCDSFSDPPGATVHLLDPCHHAVVEPAVQECRAIIEATLSSVSAVIEGEPAEAVHAAHCNHGEDSRFPAHGDTYCPAYAEVSGANQHSLSDPCVHTLVTVCVPPFGAGCEHGADTRTPAHGPVSCDLFADPGLTQAERDDNLHGVPDLGTADECMHYSPTSDCSVSAGTTVGCRHGADGRAPGHDAVYCPIYAEQPGSTRHDGSNFCVHLAPPECSIAPIGAECHHHPDNRPAAHGALMCSAYADPGGAGLVHLGPTGCIHGPDITAGVQYLACTVSGTQSQSTTNCLYPCDATFQWSVKVLVLGPPTSKVTGRMHCTSSPSPVASCSAEVQTAIAQCTNGPNPSPPSGNAVCSAEVASGRPAPYHYVVICIEPRDARDTV